MFKWLILSYKFFISNSLTLIEKLSTAPGPYFLFSLNSFILLSKLLRAFSISCFFYIYFTLVVYGGLDIDKSIGFNGINGFKPPNANLALVNSTNSFSSIWSVLSVWLSFFILST